MFSPFGAVSAREEDSFACAYPWVSPTAIDIQPLRGCDVQKETRIIIALIRGFAPAAIDVQPLRGWVVQKETRIIIARASVGFTHGY
jgi:hypothetical protein